MTYWLGWGPLSQQGENVQLGGVDRSLMTRGGKMSRTLFLVFRPLRPPDKLRHETAK
jgi:hypothetical protein